MTHSILKDDRITISWLKGVLGQRLLLVLLLVLLQVFLGIAGVVLAWILSGLVDSALTRQQSEFVAFSCGLAALMLLRVSANAGCRYLREYACSSMENLLKQRLFRTLFGSSYSCARSKHSADWMNRLTSDAALVASGVVDIVPGVSRLLVQFAGASFLMVSLFPELGLVVLLCVPVALAASVYVRRKLKALHKGVQEADGEMRSAATEYLGNMLTVHAYSWEDRAGELLGERLAQHHAARMSRCSFTNKVSLVFSASMTLMYVLCAVGCAWGILIGVISSGVFVAVIQLVGQIRTPIANITGYGPLYSALLASAERLMEAEGYPLDRPKGLLEQGEVYAFYRNRFSTLGFREVRFRYSDDSGLADWVLGGLDLRIDKGEIVALIGPSGRGKSTILKLMMGIVSPSGGKLELLDKDGNANPLDSRWRRLFAYVPQGNSLMNGTIRQVLGFFNEDDDIDEDDERPHVKDQKGFSCGDWGTIERSDAGTGRERSGTERTGTACDDLGAREYPEAFRVDELPKSPIDASGDSAYWRALEVACAAEFVRLLPQGLETCLGEGGSGLSEGQMQRIAVARAVFTGRPILLLDECTSALDEETEKRMLHNLRSLDGTTVVIVTHKPAALEIADRVVSL